MSAPILLVHGAWHGAWAWATLEKHLDASERRIVAVDLPSSGVDAGMLGGLDADVDAVRRALDHLDEPAIVVGHSYGGQVITEAAAGRDDVAHLVYVSAFVLDEGESLLSALDGEIPDWISVSEDGASSSVVRPAEVFYADVDDGVASTSADRLGHQSIASFSAELTAAAWREVASTYVLCEQDRAIPPPAQEAMAQRTGTVHRLDSSHSPFLSMPERLAGIIESVDA